jgi:hypothetical protein
MRAGRECVYPSVYEAKYYLSGSMKCVKSLAIKQMPLN